MKPSQRNPSQQPKENADLRRFAIDVIRTLRDAGYQSLWAGGCVRDQLRGVAAKDYDVATNATPDQVQALFGRRRTIAVGKQFGVIVVRGSHPDHQVEVATFRRDMQYIDGRRPTAVVFTSAEEDARRRDFTINGLFFDPIEKRIIDYVDGRADIENKILRAIGHPADRFAEDKLRMLRAIRFAAQLDFMLHEDTSRAISDLASQLNVVSAERIANELRAIFTSDRRAIGMRLLAEHGLFDVILPELKPLTNQPQTWHDILVTLEAIPSQIDAFEIVLAITFLVASSVEPVASSGFASAAQRLKLANREIELVQWLIKHLGVLAYAHNQPWPTVQPLLIHDNFPAMLNLLRAWLVRHPECAAAIEFCQFKLQLPRHELDPALLLTGDDLVVMGVPPGAIYAKVLHRVRTAQLLGEIKTTPAAKALAAAIVSASKLEGEAS